MKPLDGFEDVELLDTTSLILNLDAINLPNIYKNELEKDFNELLSDEELIIYTSPTGISDGFLTFLTTLDDAFAYGLEHKNKTYGNLVDILMFYK